MKGKKSYVKKKRDICLHSSELEVNEPSGTEKRRKNSISEEKVEATASLSTAFQHGTQPGQRGPVRIAAGEAGMWWISVSERDIDKCFPALTK